jgi:ribosomal protein L11 methyltransferase
MSWLEVSLTVNGEAAEAVADLLTRFAPDGVAVRPVSVEHVIDNDIDEVRVSGDMVVSAYLPADAALDSTRAQLEEGLWHLGQLLPLPSPTYQTIVETDWSESWKVNFHPLRVGRRLMIVPAWLNPPLAPDDIAIRLDPGMAFGTGTHPSTMLCLQAIERHLRPSAPMIDLGTGSGILAIAAAKLGAGPVLALDISSEAVRVAGENVLANGVAADGNATGATATDGSTTDGAAIRAAANRGVIVAKASLAEVLAGQFGPSWLKTPLVIANILASVIVPLLEQGLAGLLAPDGLLVVSGILDKQAYRVIGALEAASLSIAAQEHMEDWVAIIARKPAHDLHPH